jgi:hypothetical protein
MHENKTFFHFYIFSDVLTKTGYFHTEFVFFIVQKYKLAENHRFLNTYLKKTFEWAIPGPKGKWADIGPTSWAYFLQGWAGVPAQNKYGLVTVHQHSNRVTVHMHSK